MQDTNKYGQLISSDIKLHRQWFREMVKLWGIQVLYRAPKPGKNWTTYGELESNFEAPIKIGCLFHDHPDQKSMKKMGWISELTENAIIIDVDYDLPNLQVGALFLLPSGIDGAEDRLFRVIRMKNSIVYPSCVTCELVPEFKSNESKETLFDFSQVNHTAISMTDDPGFVNAQGNSYHV